MRLALRKWMVVASVAVTGVVVAGSGAAVIGSVIGPLMKELRWSNGLASSVATAYSMGGLLTAPAVGVALDRFGARAVMVFGTLAASIGLVMASHCSSWWTLLSAFTLAGIGFNASFYLPGAVIVANWMHAHTNLGMGIMSGAMSLGATLFSPAIGWSMEMYGWSLTVNGVAALIALTLPLIWFTVHSKPRYEPRTSKSPPSSATAHTARRDLLSPAFIVATAIGMLFYVGMLGMYFHVVPLLVEAGYSAHSAGLAFGGTWLLSGIGSLVLGVAADRFGTKRVLAGALLWCALGTLFLLGVRDTGVGVACVLAFVLLWGTSSNSFGQLVPVIFSERFGTQHLGVLLGVESAVAGIVGAVAPLFTGILYDRFGDYRPAIHFSAGAIFIGFALVSLINTPKHVAGGLTTREIDAAA